MLNFRKRLELIEEKKKDELARIERKLDVVIEEGATVKQILNEDVPAATE